MASLRLNPASSLLVAEHHGPTFQSEGPSTGQLALVVRLAWCNLSCPSCDVPFTWDWSRFEPGTQSRRLTVDELVKWAASSPARLIVITGGEPLLQQTGLVPLASRLTELGYRVEIETNGTLTPTPELTAATHLFLVSPKLRGFAAMASPANRINDEALTTFAESGRAVFTFVAQSSADLDEISDLEQRLGLYPIWLQPEGTTTDSVVCEMRWLSEHALLRNWHLSGRLHALLRDEDDDEPSNPAPAWT